MADGRWWRPGAVSGAWSAVDHEVSPKPLQVGTAFCTAGRCTAREANGRRRHGVSSTLSRRRRNN
eukprot:4249546-Prymnesium_polylepis.1